MIESIKIPRFMKEYASYQTKTICENNLMGDGVKAKAAAKITKAQSLYGRGLITVDEAMLMIVYCFTDN